MPTPKLTPSTASIRLALPEDVDLLCAFDHLARQEAPRRRFIQDATQAGRCYLVETSHRVAGYAVLEYTFFQHGFVSMLYVHPDYRRRGAGAMLLQHLESLCRTPKLFTSTNLSNRPMQALLEKRGYVLSGVLHHLDEGDPELVYVKFLEPRGS